MTLDNTRLMNRARVLLLPFSATTACPPLTPQRSHGRTPLESAIMNHQTSIAEYLRSVGGHE